MSKTMIAINISKVRIELKFPYHVGMINVIKQLPDRRWDADDRLWFLPLSAYHAKCALQFANTFKLPVDSELIKLTANFIPRSSVNTNTRSKLFPFQKEGVDFLHKNKRVILADDMGTGKTVMALVFVEENVEINRILIVAPASVLHNWQSEAEIWTPKYTCSIVKSNKDSIPNSNLVIMSYGIMTNRIDELKNINFDCVIFDECHYLANPKSQRTRAAKQIANIKYFIGLSGTPFLNRPIELFPLLNSIQPAIWSNYFKFGVRYCAGHRDIFGWNFSGASNLPELREKIKYNFLRRTKGEILNQLPPMIRSVLRVDLDNKAKRNYDIAYQASREEARRIKSSVNKLALIAGLRQIIGLGKVSAAIELSQNILQSKQKIVLFAHHKSVVNALEVGLANYGVLKIIGDTSSQERQNNINKFHNDNSYRIMIISLAGGEGINLQVADTLIFVEREWNPGKEGQIESRIHRLGQVNSVQIIYLIAHHTIDEHIHNLIERKREVLNQIVGLDDIKVEEIFEI